MAVKAGVQPLSVPAAERWLVSIISMSAMGLKSCSNCANSCSLSEWLCSQTKMPSPTATGVLGTVQMQWVPCGKICW